MSKPNNEHGMPLYAAARAMGVSFSSEAVPRDKFIQIGTRRFHYLEWGDPSNPPMLLLHGYAQTCHSWDFIALGLSEKYRVIALDLRGHGDSDWSSDNNYTLEAYSDDLHTIIEKLNITNFIIIGLSVGGKTSFTYASKHTDKIRALIVRNKSKRSMHSVLKKDSFSGLDGRLLLVHPRAHDRLHDVNV